MPGETSLNRLLTNMSPELREGDYVFCVIKEADGTDFSDTKPFATINEAEGLTLILLKQAADHAGLDYQNKFRCITLNVHSSLEAVGLTAAISTALADNKISANIIAGYFHDHIFVQSEFASRALGILLKLSE